MAALLLEAGASNARPRGVPCQGGGLLSQAPQLPRQACTLALMLGVAGKQRPADSERVLAPILLSFTPGPKRCIGTLQHSRTLSPTLSPSFPPCFPVLLCFSFIFRSAVLHNTWHLGQQLFGGAALRGVLPPSQRHANSKERWPGCRPLPSSSLSSSVSSFAPEWVLLSPALYVCCAPGGPGCARRRLF